MKPSKLEALIAKAKAGALTQEEQQDIADELTIYRDMALRLERAIHALIKATE